MITAAVTNAADDEGHVIAYRAWRAGWIRTINKHKPTRNERRAARKALATKEH